MHLSYKWFKKESLVSLNVNGFIKEDRVNNSPSECCNLNTSFNWMQWHLNIIVGIIPSSVILRINETRKVKPGLIRKKNLLHVIIM
jgi:hypothetical protein